MQFKRVKSNRTLALARVNLLLGRVFSVAAPIIGFQMLSNGLAQNAAHDLNQFWFWLNWGGLAAAYLWTVISIWWLGDAVVGYRAIVIATFFAMATWGLTVGTEVLAPGEQPWIWWGVGVAGIAALGGFEIVITSGILVALPTVWFALQVSEIGAPIDPWVAFQDASFTFLFSSVIAGFVSVMRYESAKVDAANHAAGVAAIKRALRAAEHFDPLHVIGVEIRRHKRRKPRAAVRCVRRFIDIGRDGTVHRSGAGGHTAPQRIPSGPDPGRGSGPASRGGHPCPSKSAARPHPRRPVPRQRDV